MFETAIVRLRSPGHVFRFVFTIFFPDLLVKSVVSSLLISLSISSVALTMIVKLVCSMTVHLTLIILFVKSTGTSSAH